MNEGLTNWLRQHLIHISVLLTLAVGAQCLLIGTGVVHPHLGSTPQVAPLVSPHVATPAPSAAYPPLLDVLRELGQINPSPVNRTTIAVDPADRTTEVRTTVVLRTPINPAELTKANITMRSATEATVTMPQLGLNVDVVGQQYRVVSNPEWQPVTTSTSPETVQFAGQQLRQLTSGTDTVCAAAYHATRLMQDQARKAGVSALNVVFPGLTC